MITYRHSDEIHEKSSVHITDDSGVTSLRSENRLGSIAVGDWYNGTHSACP